MKKEFRATHEIQEKFIKLVGFKAAFKEMSANSNDIDQMQEDLENWKAAKAEFWECVGKTFPELKGATNISYDRMTKMLSESEESDDRKLSSFIQNIEMLLVPIKEKDSMRPGAYNSYLKLIPDTLQNLVDHYKKGE